MTRHRRSKKIIHEGRYAAEVFIDLEYSEARWSPTMSAADAQKLETVGLALRRNAVVEAPGAVASSSLSAARSGTSVPGCIILTPHPPA
jgi:hypothetical protein